ncbi:MAG: paraslipin [Clostridiales bacterium]|nr:paraslipin [Clostridiales bacterium]
MPYLIGALGIVIIIIIGLNVRIVPQAHAFVIERFGAFSAAWQTGLHVKIPFIEKIAKKIDLKEQVFDFAPQPVITKDNVTIMVDTIVFFQIFDAKLFAYGVASPIMAIENLCATTLRNIVGDLELDQTLTSRDIINGKMRTIVDEATDPWGIKVTRVELKSITPPQAIKDAMEKQMKAEREKREQVLTAQGRKEAAILEAEGDKQAAILRADAVKEKTIREAEGEAQAILAVQKARADAIEMIKKAGPTEAVIRLESLAAFKAAAAGSANKIIIPSDIQGAASIVAALGELVTDK